MNRKGVGEVRSGCLRCCCVWSGEGGESGSGSGSGRRVVSAHQALLHFV
jgi:hypothetical protein